MAKAATTSGRNGTAQGIPLLATKLYVPRAQPGPVARPHLTDRLNQALDKRLILICAPAGSGKTTLLNEWRTTSPAKNMPFAWVSLDQGDNDPTRFWAYVIAALQRLHPEMGAEALAAFRSLHPPAPEMFLPPLINELAALPDELVLALDDYHAITADAIHHAVAYLLEHLPPQVHLVIASRTEPPLPLSLLRGRGQLLKLGMADLRFTPAEASEFLNQVMGLDLSPQQIAALEERTEGWIVGLQMAAISLQGRQDAGAFIQAFSGSHRHVADYLAEQVLALQPEAVRAFLLQTSLLDRLCGSLCEAVSEQPDGQGMLERLEAANLFVIPLDDERRWFRYHHLFADVLHGHIHAAHPERVPALHRRAAEWFEAHAFYEEAIHHALAAGDVEEAGRLVENAFEPAWWDSMPAKVAAQAWLDALPKEVLRSGPSLCLNRVDSLLYLSGGGELHWPRRLAEVEALLRRAEELLERQMREQTTPSTGQRRCLGRLFTLRAGRERWQGDVAQAEMWARRALALLPADDWRLRSSAIVKVAWAYVTGGEISSAEQQLRQLAQQVDLVTIAGQIWFTVLWERGLLHEAAAHVERAQGTQYAWISVLASALYYEWNEPDAAIYALETALPNILPGCEHAALSCGVDLAKAYLARGEGQRAAEAMAKEVRLAVTVNMDVPYCSPHCLQAQQACFWLMQGQVEQARRWADSAEVGVDDVPSYARLVEHLTLARVRIAQERATEALPLLERIHQHAQAQGRERNRIEILTVQAVAFLSLGETERALETIAQALALAEPEGFIRTFVDEGEPMAKLLRLAASHGITPQYAARLLAAFPPSHDPRQPTTQPLVEPLSPRELDVLRLVAEGLSNREIAQRLYLTEGTVKVHTSNIFGKLGVHTRTQAVARAQVLGLLP